MLQPFFDFIEKLATDFSWRRMIIFFSICIALGFIYFLYESQTASSQLTRYERTVSLLEKIQNLNPSDQDTKEITKNIQKGLSELTSKNPSDLGVQLSVKREVKQAVAGGLFWFLLALFFLPSFLRNTKDDAGNVVGGCLALGLLTGLGGYFLPITWSTWLVYGLYPVGVNLVLFIILAIIGNRK